MKNYIVRHSKYPHRSDKRDFYFTDKKEQKLGKLDKNLEKHVLDLKIPPGYHPVKINLNKNSKILAIGVDKKGKNQYIYNPKWVEKREKVKYCHIKDFAEKLPKIKQKIARDIASSGMSIDKMIAVILRIILLCHFRVGNDVGRDVYNSYGITTITKKQISISGNSAQIKFIGKRGVLNQCLMKDKKVVDILKSLYKERRGTEPLFTYKESGKAQRKRVNAKDVNAYLKEFGDFTTKYFRTWVANVEFIDEIMDRYNPKESNKLSMTARKKLLRDAVVATSEKLHHTPAICKKSYISDDLIDLFIDKPKKFDIIISKSYKNNINRNLDSGETAFINFLNKIC